MAASEQSRWREFVRGCLPGSEQEIGFERLHGDGSARSFYRVAGAGGPYVLIVNPGPPRHEELEVDENETWVYMAGLLRAAGADAPEVFGFDREAGLVLCEEVDGEYLETKVRRHGPGSAWTLDTYTRLLEVLVKIQGGCSRTFEPERTFNPPYDAEFSYQAESLYFVDFFLERLCGLDQAPLHAELRLLAETVEETIGERVMIYRDFQSRNVIVQQPGDRLRLLDFQGARMGPAAYDVASLLYDPYVNLPQKLRDSLAAAYPSLLAPLAPRAAAAFEHSYPLVAVHRVMQTLGAYAKLSLLDGKTRFLAHVPAALSGLRHLLATGPFGKFALLSQTVESLKPPVNVPR